MVEDKKLVEAQEAKAQAEEVTPPTYGEVLEELRRRLGASGTGAVYLSHVRAYLRDLGLREEDPAWGLLELSEGELHRWAQRRPANAKSALRRAREVAQELQRARALRASLPPDLAGRLRYFMARAGIGYNRLSRESGVSKAMVWRILSGSTPSDPSVLDRLEEALGAPRGVLREVAPPPVGQRKGSFPQAVLALLAPFLEELEEGSRRGQAKKRFYRLFRGILRERGLSPYGPKEELEAAAREALELARREAPPEPYALSTLLGEWPEPLRSEWEAYRRFSTELARGTVKAAFMEGVSFPKRPVREPTLEKERGVLDFFFGYLHRERGLSPFSLSLLVRQPELVRDYLAWQEGRKGKVTRSESAFLNLVLKLLNPERGFLAQAPLVFPHLFPPEEGWRERAGEARERLKAAHKRLRVHEEEGFGEAEPLTRLPRPLEPLIQAEVRLRRELEGVVGDLARPRLEGLSPGVLESVLAMYHDLAAFGLLLRTALRAKHVYLARHDELGEAGEGNLVLREGRVYLRYRKEFFKNERSSFFKDVPAGAWVYRKAVEGPDFPELAPVVEAYLREVLPRLWERKPERKNLLFPLFAGMGDVLDQRWRAYLEHHLSPYPVEVPVAPGSPETVAVRVRPFGVHAVRHLTATQAIKATGNPAHAAHLLMDALDTVVKYYARFIPEEMVERAALEVFGDGASLWSEGKGGRGRG